MRLKFGFIADYAGPGHQGKLTLVGIFDLVYDRTGARPIPLPTCHLVVALEAHTLEGSDHRLSVQLTNADGQAQGAPMNLPVAFRPQGPGRPTSANVIIRIDGLTVPDLGDYAFHVLVDERHIGEIPLFVTPPPQGAA